MIICESLTLSLRAAQLAPKQVNISTSPKLIQNIEDFILASTAEPFFMEARNIFGKHHYDGGVRCVVPVAVAII